ncbi:MAG: hypothetical protein CMJ64_00880 [Planctomycetaceae bacterium]|nr:hypothetical protein [Planctomycetaceae bacterium]
MSNSNEHAEPTADSRVERQPLSRRRKWPFRLLAIGMSLAPLLLLELGLRIGGFGYETKLIVRAPHTASNTTFQFNPPADRAYYGPVDLSGPEPRHFEISKPDSVYRIVVVGGSTVAGFPYPFELAFPKHLEVILQRQLPDTRFQVLNAGITAINSFSEVDVVRQAVKCEPDLIVMHSGHNEFYGPGGSASNSSSLTPALYPVLQAVRRQRAFQLITSLIPRRTDAHLFETLPADIAIPLDGQVLKDTQARYRSNLEKIVRIAKHSRIPIVLSTVSSNLRDLSPLQTTSGVVLTEREAQEQQQQLKKAMRHMSYKKYELALEQLTQALRIDSSHPLLTYRRAQCLELLERHEEAAAAYALAADLDGCRLRAPSSFANVVREVAANEPGGVYFCDVATRFQSVSRFAAPGSDLFLEHVHYNLEGNWQAARSLAECIVEDVIGSAWNAERLPDNQRRDTLLQVTPFDHLVADAQTVGMLEISPFSLSPARDEEAKVVQNRWRSTYETLSQADQRLFTNQSLESMTHNVLLVMGHAYLLSGREGRALGSFQRHIARRPWDAAGYVGAVMALRAQGKSSDAQEVLDRVREITPNDPQVRQLLESQRRRSEGEAR